MANQFATNSPIGASGDTSNVLWKLSRVMKAAGWQYRASGFQSLKDTSGIAANDLWGSNTNPLSDTYATNFTVGAVTTTATLPITTLSYATSNGTFTTGGGSISVLTSIGWQTLTYTSCTTTTFSGVSGGTSGAVLLGVAAGINGGAPVLQGSGATGGFEGLGGTLGGPWWCASGPLTVKVPLSALPTGTPLRSEIVTQATSGATGELFGYVWDPVGLSGWAVIGPQHTPANTTLTVVSNPTSLPQSTLTVASTTGFATSGILNVWSTQLTTTVQTPSGGAALPVATITATTPNTLFPAGPGYIWVLTTGNGYQQVYYQAVSATQFTGCSGGTGTIVANGTANSVIGAQSPQQVSYTGGGGGGTTFTGCTGGTGVLLNGNAVTGYSAVFDNTHTLTGGTSGATMTPTGTVTYFQREVMLAKPGTSNVNGNIYYVAADGYLENNQFLSTLAGTVGCTPGIGPGEATTGTNTLNNVSPVTSNAMQICVVGSGSSLTGAGWFGGSGSAYGVTAQIGCANAIPAASTTADGSFYAALTVTTTAGFMTGLSFTRMDDQEPGDCDPYAWFVSQGTSTITTFSRTTNTSNTSNLFLGATIFAAGGNCYWLGYQARGASLVTHDVPYGYISSGAYCFQTTPALTQAFANNNPIRLVGFPSTAAPVVREPILLFTSGVSSGPPQTFKQIKGRARWVALFSIGNTLDTFDSKTWLAVSAWATTAPCIALGPYDGSSTPIP
jgi:hypothetical protein